MARQPFSFLVAATLLPLSAPATAVFQADQAAATLPADALAAAREYLDAEDFEAQIMQSAETSTEFMLAAMVSELQNQTGESLPEKFLSEMRKLFLEHTRVTLRAKMETIKDAAARIYAEQFTTQELLRLRQISGDPVMVKVRERSKIVDGKLMALGVQTMKAAQPELQEKLARLIGELEAEERVGADRS